MHIWARAVGAGDERELGECYGVCWRGVADLVRGFIGFVEFVEFLGRTAGQLLGLLGGTDHGCTRRG